MSLHSMRTGLPGSDFLGLPNLGEEARRGERAARSAPFPVASVESQFGTEHPRLRSGVRQSLRVRKG